LVEWDTTPEKELVTRKRWHRVQTTD
jgi:hypothetical protein